VIELALVYRMIRRGLLLSPIVIAVLAVFGGVEWALSAAIGMALALANLWVAARIIGGVVENRQELVMVAAFAAFILGLALLTVAAIVIKKIESLYFPVTGFVLIGAHMTLVTWEAADRFLRLPKPGDPAVTKTTTTRS
jgi:hypothetical protein